MTRRVHRQVEVAGVGGLLRVTCSVTLAQSTVGYLIPHYLAMYPRVKLDLRVTNRVVDLVEEGIDVALGVRPTLDDSGSLVIKQLGATSGHLLASPAQLRRQGHPATTVDLSRLDTVAMSSADGRSAWTLVGPQGEEFIFHLSSPATLRGR